MIYWSEAKLSRVNARNAGVEEIQIVGKEKEWKQIESRASRCADEGE
jgi:hypothetical protein